jgi:hypothetical protein
MATREIDHTSPVVRFVSKLAELWRDAGFAVRANLLLWLIAPVAIGVLFGLGDSKAALGVLALLGLDNALIWPVVRARHQPRRSPRRHDMD